MMLLRVTDEQDTLSPGNLLKKGDVEVDEHRWASTSFLMSAISDIDICYSDIGRKYVRLKSVIPISEEFRYRHPSPF